MAYLHCRILKQVLIAFCLVVIADSICRPRCKLGLENKGYRTCINEDSRCKKDQYGKDRCYQKLPDVQVSPAELLSTTTINASSTSYPLRHFFASPNVFSGTTGTPNICYCCWHSKNEIDPYIEITFQEKIVIAKLLIKGREGRQMYDVLRNLKYLEAASDGQKLPTVAHEFNNETNSVTIIGSEREVTTLLLTRPKPQIITASQWFFNKCEIVVYAAGEFTGGSN